MEQRRLMVASAVLGIEFDYRRDEGWYFSLGKPGPIYDWCGPYDSQQEAHSVAVRTLLYFAQIGQQLLDGQLEPDEPAPSIEVPAPWRRAFE